MNAITRPSALHRGFPEAIAAVNAFAPVAADYDSYPLARALVRRRDVRVSSEEIPRVVFGFDAGQSGKIRPVNGGRAAPRLVRLEIRVDSFVGPRTQQPQRFVGPLCQAPAG